MTTNLNIHLIATYIHKYKYEYKCMRKFEVTGYVWNLQFQKHFKTPTHHTQICT